MKKTIGAFGTLIAGAMLVSLAIQPTLAMNNTTNTSVEASVSMSNQLEMKLDQVAWEISTWPVEKQEKIQMRLESTIKSYNKSPMIKAALQHLWSKINSYMEDNMGSNQTIAEIAMSADNMMHLVAALQATDLAEMFTKENGTEYTVLAPTDMAFENLARMLGTTVDGLWEDTDTLKEILQYHVMVGANSAADVMSWPQGMLVNTAGEQQVRLTSTQGSVMFDNATVIKADVDASNGIIHVIDTVLLPPTILERWEWPTMRGEQNIVTTAKESGMHDNFVAALMAAEWDDELMKDGPFTVFVPSEEALTEFVMANDMSLNQLLNDTETLSSVLQYHVVEGRRTAEMVMSRPTNTSVTTVQGSDITLQHNENGVWVNSAMVTKADIFASNGIIHVIDEVLTP